MHTRSGTKDRNPHRKNKQDKRKFLIIFSVLGHHDPEKSERRLDKEVGRMVAVQLPGADTFIKLY